MGNLRVVVVDDSQAARAILTSRLEKAGYAVTAVADAYAGADLVLQALPDAVVTDLWMPGMSGLQLCRLLRSDAATAHVPVVLLTASDDRKARFWAGHAGAAAFVSKDRIEDLLSALATIAADANPIPVVSARNLGKGSVQDRLSLLLDAALYDAVIEAEVRALASAGDFERLFVGLSLFVSQLATYRWLALATTDGRMAMHCHPRTRVSAEREARLALECPNASMYAYEDPLAADERLAAAPSVRTIHFGTEPLGKIAFGARGRGLSTEDDRLVGILAQQLGGPIRMATLVEESRRLAATDTLTGLMNRRAFSEAVLREIATADRYQFPISLLMLDVDHFKKVNDTHGHGAGDAVLVALAAVLGTLGRKSDYVARWGGEEFVVSLSHTGQEGARIVSERLRKMISEAKITIPDGPSLSVTASIGVALHRPKETLDELVARADAAMYAAKTGGRNRVELAL